MWLIRAWLSDEIKSSPHLAEILYSCATCGNCKDQCVFPRFRDYLLDIFQEAKTELVNDGQIPPEVRDYFKAVMINGNPYKAPQQERGKWAEGTGIKKFSGQEYLFYVGCVGSYDEVGQKMARQVGTLLNNLGISLGILGDEEGCDGNEVKVLGESGLFQKLAAENIKKFTNKGVKKIITLDPHALNSFKKDYPAWGGKFLVYHYTEILAKIVKEKKENFKEYKVKVTYHDPCYLGRHNLIYTAPREVLKKIPGLELIEMRRHQQNSFCCGGGGGNFFTDILNKGEYNPSRLRVREALATGAQILAVACPICAKMLTDAVKAEELENKLEVLDIAQIVQRAGK
jgi:Fe-S oxidoreductase